MKKIIIFLCCFTAISHVLLSQEYNPEKKIVELGFELKEPSTPIANYVNVVRTGNLLFLSGKGPLKSDGTYVTGKLGVDLTIEEGYNAAKLVAINQLAVLKK